MIAEDEAEEEEEHLVLADPCEKVNYPLSV